MRRVIAMIDKNKINEMLKNSGADSSVSSQISDFLNKMTDEDIAKLNSVLNDKSKQQKILNSPKAKDLINRLNKGNNGKN